MSNFPHCEISWCEQRTEEWYDLRKGKLTGSQFGTWLAEEPECRYTVSELRQQIKELVGEEPPKKLTRPALIDECYKLGIELPKSFTVATEAARRKAIAGIIGQLSSCEVPPEWEIDEDGPPPRNRSQWAIWNGIRSEPKAEAQFEIATGLELEKPGFCTHRSGLIGVSPDGLVKGKNEGFEGKAPLPETHALYLLNGTLPDNYKAQVHGSMAATGADAWWFQSYCPGLPSLRLKIQRDEFTERMAKGLELFAKELRDSVKQVLEILRNQKS